MVIIGHRSSKSTFGANKDIVRLLHRGSRWLVLTCRERRSSDKTISGHFCTVDLEQKLCPQTLVVLSLAKRRSVKNIKLVCASISATEGIFLELEHDCDNIWSGFSDGKCD